MVLLKEKVNFTFNSQLKKLLTEISNINKQSDLSMDFSNLKTPVYLNSFKSSMTTEAMNLLVNKKSNTEVLKDENILENIKFSENVTLRQMVDELKSNENLLLLYIYILNFVLTTVLINDDTDEELFSKTFNVQKEIQFGNLEIEELLDDINNVVIKRILRKMCSLTAMQKDINNFSEFGDMFKNKELKNIAQGIVHDLMNDPSLNFRVNNMQDVMEMFSSGKFKLILDKGLESIRGRLGENGINQQIILDEVMNLFMKLKPNDSSSPSVPDISSLMNMFGNNMKNVDPKKINHKDTKNRIQQELEKLKLLDKK